MEAIGKCVNYHAIFVLIIKQIDFHLKTTLKKLKNSRDFPNALNLQCHSTHYRKSKQKLSRLITF